MTRRQIDLGPTGSQVESVEWAPPIRGPEAWTPIVILCDAPTQEAWELGLPLHWPHHKFLAKIMKKHGFGLGDIRLLGLCPPLLSRDYKSSSRKWKHVEAHISKVRDYIRDMQPQVVVTFGEMATRTMYGRPVAITKIRGVPIVREGEPTLLPMLSPGYVNRIPDHIPTFAADVATLARIKDAGFDAAQFVPQTGNYEWVTDLRPWRNALQGQSVISVDTETQGGTRWWDERIKLLSVQIAYQPGHALVVPVCDDWCGQQEGNVGDYGHNRHVLKIILENREIRKIGHNIKFEHMQCRKIGIEIQGWLHDTQLMLFNVDENMLDKKLESGVKIYVPEMSGYCVTPSTRLLTTDMRWVCAGDVKVGDDLVGFEEHPQFGRNRKMDVATVEGVTRLNKPSLQIIMKSGRTIIVSDNHQFLRRRTQHGGGAIKWTRADKLVVGQSLKIFPMSEFEDSYESGWFSGFMDGEGWGQRLKFGGFRMGYAQKPGAVLDKAQQVGGTRPKYMSNGCANCTFTSWQSWQVIQRHRPIRMINEKKWVGTTLPRDPWDEIVSIRDVGTKEVVSIKTTTHTFIAEGIASHNSDEFDQTYDKSNMAAVPRDDVVNEDGTTTPGFVTYSGGDSDATLRLAKRLKPIIDSDPRHRNCYRRIQLPSIMTFANTIELHGMKVDQQKLEEFGETIDAYLEETYLSLIARAPAAVKADHLERNKELKFSRPDFTRDVLFSKHGFNLQPITFTNTTEELDPEFRVASTSAKKHLPYFTDNKTPLFEGGTVGDYVNDLMQYQKAVKLKSTYVGHQEHVNEDGNTVPASGLWQYLAPNSHIYPSYMLHRTNTGRTASADPNGQNFPTRGNWAKAYKEVFEASRSDFVMVSCDLSQIELRLVAWMSGDPTMQRIYREGGDIHAMTAATTLGVEFETFMAWKLDDRLLRDVVDEVKGADLYLRALDADKRATAKVKDYYDLKRFQAKAINFGLVYGMSARGLRVYAKTEYGIDYSEEESYRVRETFFKTYWGLPIWHRTMHQFAEDNGYVRSLHGAVRHLPSIYSDDPAIRAAAKRYAVNSPIQRFGSDLGLIGMNRFAHQADPRVIRLHGFVHDALYLEARQDMAEEAASALKWAMQSVPLQEWFGIESPIPILADAEVDGVERPDLAAVKPDWWDDDEAGKAQAYLNINRSDALSQLRSLAA